MKAENFVNEALRLEKLPTIYGWGNYFNKKSGKYYKCDCSGLIKAIFWGYPSGKKKYADGFPDHNANTIIKSDCSEISTDFSKIVKGAVVWMDGHIGIYAGNNKVVESSPIWENGVQITNISQRKWRKWGKLKKVDYSQKTASSNSGSTAKKTYFKKYTGKSNSIVDALKSIGAESSYSYREKIAKANSISNYKGTAEQNTKMLDKLKKGTLIKP